MEAWKAVRGMMGASGVGPSDLSRRLGHSRSYITASISQGGTPRLDTFARIARACGYRLVLETEDGSRGVELYSEVDEKQEDATAVDDESSAILEKTMGRDAMERLSVNEWYEALSKTAPRALEAIRRREAMFFEDGDHVGDAYDTITTDVFSPWS